MGLALPMSNIYFYTHSGSNPGPFPRKTRQRLLRAAVSHTRLGFHSPPPPCVWVCDRPQGTDRKDHLLIFEPGWWEAGSLGGSSSATKNKNDTNSE